MFYLLLKRAFYISPATLIASLSSAISGIIIARYMGPESFGSYASALALVEISIVFTEIGLTTGLQRDSSRRPELMPMLFGNAFIVEAFLGLCVLIIAYFLLPFISNDINAHALFLPLSLAGFSVLISRLIFSTLHVKGKQDLVAILITMRGFIFLGGVILLVFNKYDILAIAWLHGGLYFLMTLVGFYITVNIVSIKLKPKRILSDIKESYVFGLSAHLHSVWNSVPILLVSHYLNAKEVGYFTVAQRFTTFAVMPGHAARTEAFLPTLFKLYSTNRDQLKYICQTMQKLFIPVGVFIASALYVFADFVIITLIGEEYRPAIRILRIMCWYVAFGYGTMAADASLTASDMMWQKVIIQTVVTLVTIGTGLYIIEMFGILGASYLMVITWMIALFLFFSYAYKKNLLNFTGLSEIIVPTAIMISISIITVYLFVNINLLRYILFLIGSLMIMSPTLIKKVRTLKHT